MRLRNRILGILAIVVTVAFVSLAVALSYDSSCGPSAALPAGSESMQGFVARCYGAPNVLKLEQLAKPTPADDQLLVKVHAAALNPVDWHSMRGSPYIMRLSIGYRLPEGRTRRRRLRRNGRGCRQERHALQAGRRSVRRRGRLGGAVRRRSRDPRRRTQASQRELRTGRRRGSSGSHRAAGPARPRRNQARTESADQRRVRRCGHLRRTDRQALRRRCHRCVQHAQRRAGALARRRPRDRLHARGFHAGHRALRHRPGQRRQSFALRPAPRPQAERRARHRRRRQGRLDRAAVPGAQGNGRESRSSIRGSASSSHRSSSRT